MDSEEFNLAVISDLHLSQGWDPRTRRLPPHEDFFFDDVFARFLAGLEAESRAGGRKWRLIVAGDMVDFLQVLSLPAAGVFHLRPREREYGLGTALAKTIWKMQVMMGGHKVFFRALARFLASGHRLVVISGNHDIEWSVPGVQQAFRQGMVALLPGDAPAKERLVTENISFCPWFYYEKDLVWIEHGHQYDGINSFDWLLHPWLPEGEELMLPAGSFFVRYLFNKVEQQDPFADNIKPLSSYLWPCLLRLLRTRQIRLGLKSFLNIMDKIAVLDERDRAILEEKQCVKMAGEAQRFGLLPADLKAVRALWAPCNLYNRSRWENLRSFFAAEQTDHYQRRAALLQEIVRTPFIIFGHTHEADLRPLPGATGGYYVNSGSWCPVFCASYTDRLLREEQEFVYVRIGRDYGGKMELMRWRDDLQRGERVRLFP